MTVNAVGRPQDKLVPVIAHGIAAINSHSLLCLYLFYFLFKVNKPRKKKPQLVILDRKPLSWRLSNDGKLTPETPPINV